MLKLLLVLMSLAVMMLPSIALAQAANGPIAVPEPTTIILLCSGLLGLWGARKKFKK